MDGSTGSRHRLTLDHIGPTMRIVTRERGDELFRIFDLEASCAFTRFERGDRLEAVESLSASVAELERKGDALRCLWYRVWLGRLLVELGRRREGRKLLGEARAAARALRIPGVAEAAAWAEQRDPVRWLSMIDEQLPAREKLGEWVRAHALAGLRAAADGRSEHAALLLAEVAAVSARPGFAMDRLIAHLARAVTFRMQERAAAADAEIALVTRAVVDEGIDPDLPIELVNELGDVLVIEGYSRRRLSSSVELARYTVVVDARSHHLLVGGTRRSLRRMFVMRRLLYTLASCPGRPVSKDALVRGVWARPYDPLLHDNPIKSNVFHLRRALVGSGVEIEFEDGGYCLKPPDRFAFVAPFSLWADATW
jgi:DNA-binding response OmpR family regulator